MGLKREKDRSSEGKEKGRERGGRGGTGEVLWEKECVGVIKREEDKNVEIGTLNDPGRYPELLRALSGTKSSREGPKALKND